MEVWTYHFPFLQQPIHRKRCICRTCRWQSCHWDCQILLKFLIQTFCCSTVRINMLNLRRIQNLMQIIRHGISDAAVTGSINLAFCNHIPYSDPVLKKQPFFLFDRLPRSLSRNGSADVHRKTAVLLISPMESFRESIFCCLYRRPAQIHAAVSDIPEFSFLFFKILPVFVLFEARHASVRPPIRSAASRLPRSVPALPVDADDRPCRP